MSTQNRLFKPSPALARGLDTLEGYANTGPMTVIGTIHKTAALLAIVTATAVPGWFAANTGLGAGLAIVAVIAALIVGLTTVFKPHLASKTAIVYAALEGYVIGVVSRFAEQMYPGTVLTTIILTAIVFAVMLALYRFQIIKVTRTFVIGVTAATAAVVLYSLIALAISAAGGGSIIPTGTTGIIFSILVVVIAAANLAVDFALIEDGERQGLPAQAEWYAAFSLVVTLVWLYLEVLRLITRLQSGSTSR